MIDLSFWNEAMTRDRIVKIGMSLLLSSSLLVACGGGDSTSSDATTELEEPTAETVTPSEPETPTAPTEPAEPPSTPGTAISPPQAATLTATQADAQINLRSQPTTESNSPGYGLVGDPVQLLRAAEGEGELTWYYVKFDKSGAEGWIRGDFIRTGGNGANNSLSGPLNAFTTDELFAVGGGGCGMTLWPADNPGSFIFFNGLPGESMWMKLDGTMTEFRRTAASGPEFYGQSATQSFVSNDGNLEVNVTASVGSEKGYESVNIEQGRLILEGVPGGPVDMTVVGDAGC
jgi:hypothetical protein